MTATPSEPDGRPHEIRHADRTKSFTRPSGEVHRDEITAHVEKHFGKVDRVFHEMISDLVHLDVLCVEPTDKEPWFTLVTSGMSDLPMRVPDGEAWPRHAELVMRVVPPRSLHDEGALQDERVYWPIRHLKMSARMPHELDTWLAPGHTIATDPPQFVAEGVGFCAFGVLELLEEDARRLRCADGTEIMFLHLVPLYREELEWRLQQTAPGALAELFDSTEMRLAMEERPNLKGGKFDAMVDRHATRILLGRRLVIAIAVLMVVFAAADVAACHADGVRLPWTRLGVTVLIASYVAQGNRWLRWAAVLLLTLGAGGGVFVLAKNGITTWRSIGLATAVPVWIVMAATLAFATPVRAFFAAKFHSEDS